MEISSIPMHGDIKNCELHNVYDVQFCILAAVSTCLGAVMCFYGYKFFKFILFSTGLLIGFFITYTICVLYLTDLSESLQEHKQQAIIIISTSFLGAFCLTNGLDYYIENNVTLYYSIKVLHGYDRQRAILVSPPPDSTMMEDFADSQVLT
ncbi:hypothetical protein QZH41_011216 [Actinostola sp. cb2023]|nr:hypothetical protein QZH41_011216 [Actinostola sp. cb2023]